MRDTVCSRCHSRLAEGARYCMQCGSPVGRTPDPRWWYRSPAEPEPGPGVPELLLTLFLLMVPGLGVLLALWWGFFSRRRDWRNLSRAFLVIDLFFALLLILLFVQLMILRAFFLR